MQWKLLAGFGPGAVPAWPGQAGELSGGWYKRKMPTVKFVNPATGTHAHPSGERLRVTRGS